MQEIAKVVIVYQHYLSQENWEDFSEVDEEEMEINNTSSKG